MKNGYSLDSLTSVEIRETVKTGRKVIQIKRYITRKL